MKKNFIRYTDTPDEANYNGKLEVYLAHGEGYMRYTLKHVLDSKINADSYIIDIAAYVDSDLNVVEKLTTPGEWEMAIKLKDRPDFFGGRMHGDELMEVMVFFVDDYMNQKIYDGNDIEFDNLTIIEGCKCYDPSDSTTPVAKHEKQYIFEGNKLTIAQRIDWLVDCELGQSYMAMFPASKAVTSRFYTNLDKAPREIVYDSFDGVTSVVSFGEKFSGRFAVEKYTKSPQDTTFLMTDNGGGHYNKQYYIAAKVGDTVNAGDRWDTVTTYELNYKA